MSTMELDETTARIAPQALEETASATDPAMHTYRGKTLEELLPQIRTELGPDAIVVRQRDGLMGGFGGFFQQQFVEVDARAGHARIDVYDEPPAVAGAGFAALLAAAEENAEPTVEARSTVVSPSEDDVQVVVKPKQSEVTPSDEDVQVSVTGRSAEVVPAEPEPRVAAAPVRTPDALAESVREAALAAPKPAAPAKPVRITAPKSSPHRSPQPKAASRTAQALSSPEQLVSALTDRGLGERLASQLVADATAHELPFAGGDLRVAIARTLARRIPMPPPRRAGGMATAFAGPAGAGKTHCVAALAAAYAQASATVVCLAVASKDAGAELTRLLEPFGVEVHAVASAAGARTLLRRAPRHAVVVLDTHSVSPTDSVAVAELADQLASFNLDETQLVVPAALDADAALDLYDRLAPLRPTGIAMTRADAAGGVGGVVDMACMTRLPLAYVATRDPLPAAIAPADPVALMERLLP